MSHIHPPPPSPSFFLQKVGEVATTRISFFGVWFGSCWIGGWSCLLRRCHWSLADSWSHVTFNFVLLLWVANSFKPSASYWKVMTLPFMRGSSPQFFAFALVWLHYCWYSGKTMKKEKLTSRLSHCLPCLSVTSLGVSPLCRDLWLDIDANATVWYDYPNCQQTLRTNLLLASYSCFSMLSPPSVAITKITWKNARWGTEWIASDDNMYELFPQLQLLVCTGTSKSEQSFYHTQDVY